MAITPYLAMTAAEFQNAAQLPPRIAWMACHFSPYSTGLSNLPDTLPPNSLLILNDITPIHSHDPEVIAEQLTQCVQALGCIGVLLDFQRSANAEIQGMVSALVTSLSCPVAVSEPFARDISCPVFLPPCPPHKPLQEHLAPWKGREIWLEAALDGEAVTVTRSGADFSPSGDIFPEGFQEISLHCHYSIEAGETNVKFTLHRTAEDLAALLEEAEEYGVTTAVGLFQEFSSGFADSAAL